MIDSIRLEKQFLDIIHKQYINDQFNPNSNTRIISSKFEWFGWRAELINGKIEFTQTSPYIEEYFLRCHNIMLTILVNSYYGYLLNPSTEEDYIKLVLTMAETVY